MKPLAFVIITFNRESEMLALIKNIECLEAVNLLVEEVVIVNNASITDYALVEDYIKHSNLPINYIKSTENLGVARGRNYAIESTSAPYLIMLDDDAELQNKDCLQQIINEFNCNNTDREKVIVSFKVLYYATLQMQKNALPHKNYSAFKGKDWFETYYFAGGAHCIKRTALVKIGNYPSSFFYGMEEYDLSYRLIKNNYTIVYSNKIIMLHKESPLGRKPKVEKIKMMWVNKSIVAKKYLPKKYFYSTVFLWSLFFLKNNFWQFRHFFNGWKQIVFLPKANAEFKLSKSDLVHLKKLKARLWY